MSEWSEHIFEIWRNIREATEGIEDEMGRHPEGSRARAELHLAWRHLLDAHSLLSTGRLTPDDILWGREVAQRILERKTPESDT